LQSSVSAELAFKVYDVEERSYFENERMIYQLLRNQCGAIVKYHGWLDMSDSLVLALTRIKPGCLRDFLSTETNLDGRAALKIMKDVATGLSFLHGNNNQKLVIAHR